jgi:hypothetical protein
MRNCVRALPTIGAAALIGILVGILGLGHSAKAQSQSATQVVMLGTGTPGPDPDRARNRLMRIPAADNNSFMQRCEQG